jgi:hypothetical protein
MAGVGPYGIEQVDVPGALGAYQAMQGNRIKMMMEQKQLEMMDRQMQIQSSMMSAGRDFVDRLYPSSGGAASGSSDSSAPSGPSPAQVSSAMSTAGSLPAVGSITAANAAGQPAAVPSAAPSAGTMGSSINLPPESITNKAAPMLAMYSFLNPDQAQAMGNVFEKMDAAQATQWKQKNGAIVNEFAGLLQLPYAQRKAAIQQNIGDLQRLGYTPQQIAGFDPTDGNIRMEIGKHTDADHVMDLVNPHFENMRAGGAVSETQPYGSSSIVAQSPILNGPHGSVFATPPSANGLPVVSTPQDAAKLPPGSKFRLPDGRIGTVPGGAGGNASGGFQ